MRSPPRPLPPSQPSRAPSPNLQPVASAAMNDKSDAVALWGLRAAGAVMNSTPGAPDPRLLSQIPQVVQNHNLNGAITEEAYLALRDSTSPKEIDTLIKL